MTHLARELTSVCLSALGQKPAEKESLVFTGDGAFASVFPVTELAAACHATVGLALVRLMDPTDHEARVVNVDRRLASGWFQQTIKPQGWEIPGPWDTIAGDYRSRDGWIRLHTNAPHHRQAAQHVLGQHADKAAMAKVVQNWFGDELEAAVVDAGGCAARMRSVEQWAVHPQGCAVGLDPLIDLQVCQPSTRQQSKSSIPADRPLGGIRVLDLTRVLAGPVATRTLAGFGAQVLRLDPPIWDEPAVVPEVVLGKRCARLDLRTASGLDQFKSLLSQADVLVHGYRPGALDALGLGTEARRSIAPGLIDVSLNAYGWQGPWSGRRGFDSLVQMSSGIAHAAMQWQGADSPVPLPAQALDHATGWLMAATVLHGLASRQTSGTPVTARLSLARTAALLVQHIQAVRGKGFAQFGDADYLPGTEQTSWGPAKRLRPALTINGLPMRWTSGATSLGAHPPLW